MNRGRSPLKIVSRLFPIMLATGLLLITGGCKKEEIATSPFGLDTRPTVSCPAPDRPQEATGVRVEQVFSTIPCEYPVALYPEPGGGGRWYLVEQSGRVRSFSTRGDSFRTVLDLRHKVAFSGEAGLLDLAFHPKWIQNRQVFLSYTGLNEAGRLTSYISRFRTVADPPLIDPGSEEVVLSQPQPYYNHNGGRIDFGPDGFLYIGFGDGGSGGDPLNAGQDRNTLLGKFLRIDIDAAPPYGIPTDNPFAAGGGRPEIYAWGFRNPWRWSFDRDNGDLWAADVGQNRWEEVNLVRRGGNYGWRIREGAHCYNPDPCDSSGLIDPMVEYSHQEGCSVTGGYVYRGSAIPGLVGVFLFGDYCNGSIWGVFADANGNPTRKLLANTGLNIVGFAQDNDGEVYVLHYGGSIHKILPLSSPPATFPDRLSRTGFTDPQNPQIPSPCLIPYDLQEPFWSEGAEKERLFHVPTPLTIGVAADGHLDFPIGSVLVKHFRINRVWVETRLFVRHGDGAWGGYSYEWNEAQTDATLLTAGKTRQVQGQTWVYPSRAQCLQCHTAAAGRTLGTEIAQLNRLFTYPASGRRANQLATYNHISLLSPPLTEAPERLPVLPQTGDTSPPIGSRAKSYLHVNCSYCHRPGGTARGDLDLRYTTPLAEMNACGQSPRLHNLDIADARLIAPGVPTRSILLQRMKRLDVHRMPPIGGNRLDQSGIALIESWIVGLTECR